MARETFQKLGTSVAASPADAARGAEIVGICMRDDKEGVTEGRDGIVSTTRPGLLVAIHSAIRVKTIPALPMRLPEKYACCRRTCAEKDCDCTLDVGSEPGVDLPAVTIARRTIRRTFEHQFGKANSTLHESRSEGTKRSR